MNELSNQEFKAGETVKLISQMDCLVVQQQFLEKINIDTEFTILLVVHNADVCPYNKRESGLVVIIKNGKPTYPYVWEFKRFKKI
jgi:hypothetical protein